MASEVMLPLTSSTSIVNSNKAVLSNQIVTTDLSDQFLNLAIINAAPRQRAMSFSDISGNQITKYSFSLNPQKVVRTRKSVEVEFPTMSSWHTYRWMVEPPLWEITGYAGFLGPQVIQNIVDLDGQDNIQWAFPYIFSNKRSVKIIASQVQYTTPYSIFYQINLRELPAIVRNYIPVGLQPFKTTDSFVSPNFDINPVGSSLDSFQITRGQQDITAVAQAIISQGKSNFPITLLMSQIISINDLKNAAWPGADGPTSQKDGSIVTEISFPR